MNKFEAIFGIRQNQVKKNCVLMPLLPKGILGQFKIKKLSSGRLYNCGQGKDFTLINTRIGHSFVGDVVLYLKETPCQNIILFGSCGLVQEKFGLTLGSLVVPEKCYSQESFTEMLLRKDKKPDSFYPNRELLEKFLEISKGPDFKRVTCSTLGSLKLEEGMTEQFIEDSIDVVDMECSALFSAAESVRLRAIALFYISDIINKAPFYFPLEPNLKSQLDSSVVNAAKMLSKFIQEKLAD